MAPAVRFGQMQDVDSLVRLVNRAFVAESPYIDGKRVNPDGIRELLYKGKFLLLEENNALLACVYIEPRGVCAHIGLVSVDPARQGAGLGSQVMAAAEEHCRSVGYRDMELRFINHRSELERFYSRLGFSLTGITERPDGTRVKVPFHFVQMAKPLA
jgi:GNAT superfamily N-acetyltransferase